MNETLERYLDSDRGWSRYEKLTDRYMRSGATERGARSLSREYLVKELTDAARVNQYLGK